MRTITLVILAMTGVAILFTNSADAVCCGLPCSGACDKMGNKCHDCTTSSTCCATGACNIFCCNCDGVCRDGVKCWNCNCPITRLHALYGVESETSHEERLRESANHLDGVFASADLNQDGKLSDGEAAQWLRVNKPVSYVSDDHFQSEFKKMDVNNDGLVTREEVDPGYAETARKFGPKG